MDTSRIEKITTAEVVAYIEQLKAAGIDPKQADRGQIARICKISNRRARTIREKIQSGFADTPDGGSFETIEETANEKVITLKGTRIHTKEQLLEHYQIDTSIWEVDRFVANVWEMALTPPATTVWCETKAGKKWPAWVREDGEVKIEPLYQVKCWLKKKAEVIAIRSEIESMMEDAKKVAPRYTPIARPKQPSGNLLEISMPDLHFGRLAWGQETGWGDYDHKIAEARYREALATLLQRTSYAKYDKILLVVGNDLFNADNQQGTTTKGTPQDVDSRYQKIYTQVRRVMVETIEQCRLVAPVDVLMVSGNHDMLSVFCLGDSLECWFRNTPDVKIDNAPTLRKYYEWGKVMLCFIHGDKGKFKEYPLLMATEQREMFGRTAWHEIHCGDKHQTHLLEQNGVRVRILPSLAESSAWEAENAYVGNIKSAEAYVWNRNDGLIGTAVYSVPRKEERHNNRATQRAA